MLGLFMKQVRNIFLVILISFTYLAAQVTPSAQPVAAPASQTAQTSVAVKTTQPQAPSTQQKKDIVLGRSYTDIQQRYKILQQQKQQALQQKSLSKKASTQKSSQSTTPKQTANAPATSHQQSIQDYYWNQQLNRQQQQAGIQSPQSISALEKQTYAGIKNPPTPPKISKPALINTNVSQPSAQKTLPKKNQRTLGKRKKRTHKKNRRKKASATQAPATTNSQPDSQVQQDATQSQTE